MQIDADKLIAYIQSVQTEEPKKEKPPKCDTCKKLGLFDPLYRCYNIEDGFGFEVIKEIHFCPVCGRELD